jgi:hypothetical protein
MKRNLTIQILLLIGVMLIATACGSGGEAESSVSEENNSNLEPDPVYENRVPNNGAGVEIVAPASGDSFKQGTQVILEIETDNFDMLEEGNHWHVYINGQNWGMVTGGNMDQPLTGLTAGEHKIEVFLSIDTHEELEEGDSIVIQVDE